MASSKGNEVLENLSERKKNLLEARFLRQAPSSLDGLSTGSRSTSCSPASFQKQHQGLVNEEGMGRSPTPSLFLSPGILGRQKSAEPTVLDMTDTNSGGDESRENCLQTSLPTSHRHSFAVAAPPVAAAAAGSIRAVNGHGTSSHDLSRHLPKSHPPQPSYKPRGKEDAFLASQHNNPKNSGGKNVRQAEQGQEGRNHTDVKALQLSSPFSRDNTTTLVADRLSASVRETSPESIGAAAGPPLPAATSLPSLGGNKGAPSSGTCMTASESHTAAPASMCMTAHVSAAATAASVGKKRPRTSGLVIEEPPAHQPHLPASQKSPVDDGSRPPSMSPGRMAADGVGKTRTIVSYFHPSGAGGNSSSGHAGGGLQRTGSEAGRAQASSGGGLDVGPHAVCGTMPDHEAVQQALLSQIQNLERQLHEATGEVARLGREGEEHEALSTNLREELVRAQDEVQRLKEEAAEKEQRAATCMEDILRKLIHFQERETRELLGKNSHRLGRIVSSRNGPHGMTEIWEEGTAHKELQKQSAELLQRREELDRRKRQLAKESRKALATLNSASTGSSTSASGWILSGGPVGEAGLGPGVGEGSADGAPFDELQLMEAEEGVRMHLGQLKKDEATVQEARKSLEREKSLYVRELRRVQHEDRSRFSRRPVMNGRYLLLALLGRGGFSEVWKAFDMREYCEAAVKIHQLNSAWTEEKKHNYMKHATREYAIHREMIHPRVVRLFDVFEIDSSSFATVLEYCKGTDLDHLMKTQKIIPERDARAITMQILSGLRYLNTPSGEGANRRQGIIHYDLKPGNILFDEQGDVKITDFGLSKIVDGSCDGSSLELTSQGAGTYWYLPPECFVMGSTPPRISSKVDVWALGVIFFQMLFGSRPFGEGQTQEKVLHESTMLRATRVSFPAKPPISADAKEFIRACLTHSQADRPDVLKLCAHPYLRLKKL